VLQKKHRVLQKKRWMLQKKRWMLQKKRWMLQKKRWLFKRAVADVSKSIYKHKGLKRCYQHSNPL